VFTMTLKQIFLRLHLGCNKCELGDELLLLFLRGVQFVWAITVANLGPLKGCCVAKSVM
jgi:hypothetical protein